jgi:hypothetical protein
VKEGVASFYLTSKECSVTGMKRSGREAKQSHLSLADVKQYNYIPLPRICNRMEHSDSCTCLQTYTVLVLQVRSVLSS